MEPLPSVFLCFSGTARGAIAESFAYHLSEYGLDVWYDYHELTLGDKGDVISLDAIRSCKYAAILITDDFFSRSGTVFELQEIARRYECNSISVLPILCGVCDRIIPSEYSWLKDLIYTYLPTNTSSESAALQIAYRVYLDRVYQCPIRSLETPLLFELVSADEYLTYVIEFYLLISKSNLNARLTTLILLFAALKTKIGQIDHELAVTKCMRRLQSYTNLNLATDFKEIAIAECCVILIANELLSSSNACKLDIL